jgi:hypothetical protein
MLGPMSAGGSSADGGPEGSATPKSGAPAAAAGEAGGGDALSRKRAYKEKWQEGVALFNKKPKKGITLLQVGGSRYSLCNAAQARLWVVAAQGRCTCCQHRTP